MTRHVDERTLPQSHRLGAIKEGFIDFGAPSDATFVFVGHRVSQILLNGDLAYTFTYIGSVLQTVINHLRGTELTFSYSSGGTLLDFTSDDAP